MNEELLKKAEVEETKAKESTTKVRENGSDEFNLLKEIMLECGFILSY